MSPLERLTRFAWAGALVLFGVLSWLALGPLNLTDFGTFDVPASYGYSVDAARGYLKALEDTGASDTYLGLHRWLDTLFPILLAGGLAGIIWPRTRGPARIAMLAVVALYFVLDNSENFGVADLIRTGAAAPAADILAVRFLTTAKMAAFVLAALCAVLAWWTHRRKRTAT